MLRFPARRLVRTVQIVLCRDRTYGLLSIFSTFRILKSTLYCGRRAVEAVSPFRQKSRLTDQSDASKMYAWLPVTSRTCHLTDEIIKIANKRFLHAN